MLTVFARRLPTVVALCCAVLLALTGYASTVLAAPGGDDEGGTPSLRDVLDTALRDYSDAKGRLDASLQRQAQLDVDMKTTELKLELLYSQVGTVAATAYRGARMNLTIAVLDSSSPDGFLHAATMAQYIARRDDRQLRNLTAAKKTYADQKKAIADEVKLQQDQLAVMDKRKKEVEAALKKAGGGQLSTSVVPGKATATQAPRNADGSWPKEGCTADDPTTTHCITPRTLHAFQQARAAGFTRYANCYRAGGSGEHPKGRAIDFSSAETTFLNSRATGDDKSYGDRLTGWLIANTDRLGVLYVIWYKQIWFPGSGWRSYSGDGTPAGDHYNHVHLSLV